MSNTNTPTKVIEFVFLSVNHGSVTFLIDGNEVEFQQVDVAERHEYSQSWFMDGYIDDKKVYEAIAEFEFGSDDFVELTDIEKA